MESPRKPVSFKCWLLGCALAVRDVEPLLGNLNFSCLIYLIEYWVGLYIISQLMLIINRFFKHNVNHQHLLEALTSIKIHSGEIQATRQQNTRNYDNYLTVLMVVIQCLWIPCLIELIVPTSRKVMLCITLPIGRIGRTPSSRRPGVATSHRSEEGL